MDSRPDRDPLRKVVLAAAREFNAGRFFEAHEVLEEGLDDVPDELWNLFVGLIQVAVGYHKVRQGLNEGAAKMLERGLEKLQPFSAQAGGLHLEALRQRVRADVGRLRTGDLRIEATDPPRLQPLAD